MSFGNSTRKGNLMIQGVIWKQILSFFFPILIGVFFQQLYNTVDAVVVGNFAGKEALASVGGSSGQIVGFIFSFFMGLSTGATVIIAQSYGAGRTGEVDGLGIVFTKPFLRLLRTPENLMANSAAYVRILLAGLVFTLIYNMGSGILRAVGDSKRPLYTLIACCGLNTVLDVLFVAVIRMGVIGAALATVICQAFSAVVVTWILARKAEGMELSLSRLRIIPATLAQILRIGLPTALAGSMFSISNMILQVAVNRMGIDTVAAWTAYGKVDSLWWMINQAFSTSITTFVGQNYGAGRPDRVTKGIREVLAMEIASAAVVTTLFITFGSHLLRLFTSDSAVVELGMELARLLTPFYAVYAISEITGAALRAEGYVFVNTVANLIGVCLYRIIWVKLIFPQGTMRQIMACYPISWTLITIFIAGYYLLKQKSILAKIERSGEEYV